MVTKFVGNAPIDALWVSDSWLPEWADAGWLAPIDGYPELMKYNADVDDFCNKSMQLQGQAVRPDLLQRLHGLLLRRGAS